MSDPLARNTDPQTSVIAAKRAREFREDHHVSILGVLWRGMTIHEIAKLSGIDAVAVGRRMHELKDAGKVRRREIGRDDSGEPIYETRLSPSGRPCCVWEKLLQPELFA